MRPRASWFVAVTLLLLASPSFQAQQPPSSGIALVLSERTQPNVVYGLAVEAGGAMWAVGHAPTNMATSPDALFPTGSGAYLERIAADGTLSYLTYLGPTAEVSYSVALDGAGNVYVTGLTQFSHGFVMKLGSAGRSIVYSALLGGSRTDTPRSIAVDAAGRAHVVGATFSPDFPVTSDAFRHSSGGGQDAFYTRLSADGATIEYSTYLGGGTADDGEGVAVDTAGNAYVTGSTSSVDFPVQNALKPAFPNPAQSGSQGFLAKFAASGALVYSTFIGGSATDYSHSVAVTPNAVYLGGMVCSGDFPGAPRPYTPGGCDWAAYVTKVRLDGSAVLLTALLDGSNYNDRALSLQVDATDVAYVTGLTASRDFPVTQDAAQITPGGDEDAFFAVIPMAGAAAGRPAYVTYLGGFSSDLGYAVGADGSGGAWIGGRGFSSDFPSVNEKQAAAGPGFVAHFAQTGAPAPESSDIVLYAANASAVVGNWQLVADSTAAGGKRAWNPNAGVPKIGTASAAPAGYVELTFNATAGLPYHLWLRMKADNDSWTNDSLFAQFSDAVDSAGHPIWRIGTTDASVVSLEDCVGCGEHGWGWNDNGYAGPGQLVTFASNGPHTVRIQQREDGISVDQVVLSTRTFVNAAPGAAMTTRRFFRRPTALRRLRRRRIQRKSSFTPRQNG